MTTDSGKVVLDIPRDRNGTFDPMLIARARALPAIELRYRTERTDEALARFEPQPEFYSIPGSARLS